MTDKSFGRVTLLVLLLIFVKTVDGFAEKVKPLNPDCEVCPVVISYEGSEAKDILGLEGARWLFKMKRQDTDQKVSKIDIDGIKPVGRENDPDQGYELLVFSSKHLIGINSIQDSSGIKIKTDYKHLDSTGAASAWKPEIQLMPTNSAAIEKDDDLAFAWEKMKASKLYSAINRGGASDEKWEEKLSQFVLHVLDTINGN